MELTLPPQLDTGTALRYLGAAGGRPTTAPPGCWPGPYPPCAPPPRRGASGGGCPSRRCRWRGRGATWPATCRAAPAWC